VGNGTKLMSTCMTLAVLTTSSGRLDVTEWDSQWLRIEKGAG